jgi:hypothetical protein
MRVVLMALLVVLLAGCGAAGTPAPADPSQTPTGTPTPSGAAAPTATQAASPSPIASPTLVSGDLLLRVTTYPDVYAAPIPPDLSVYSDGSVLTPGWRLPGFEGTRFVVRRLSSAGLARIREAFSAAVPRAGVLGTIPPATVGTASGYATYLVSVRRGGELVTARTTNASAGTGVKDLVAMAERWTDPGSLLGPDAWADATPLAYVPERWSAYVTASPDCCSEPGRPDASLLEPVLGPPEAFGEIIAAEGPVIRCGVLDASTRETLAGVLGLSSVEIGDGSDRSDATLNLGTGNLSLTVVPLLPDDRDGCSLEVG